MLDPQRYRAAAARDPFGRAIVVMPPRLAVVLAIDGVVVLAFAGLAMASYLPAGVLGFLAIGLGIGVATCIPIGIANVIVIDAAYRHGVRRAVGAGLGGALADGLYASLGIFGMGPLIGAYPTVPRVLHAISGVFLIVYGAILFRSRPVMVGTDEPRPVGAGHGELRRGVAIGLATTLLNPSALVTWVVIVGAHATGITRAEAAAWVSGIVVGAFAWFLVVVFLALRGRRVLRGKAAWLTHAVGLIVVGTGLFSLSRVFGVL